MRSVTVAGIVAACREKQLLPHRTMKNTAAKIILGWTIGAIGI